MMQIVFCRRDAMRWLVVVAAVIWGLLVSSGGASSTTVVDICQLTAAESGTNASSSLSHTGGAPAGSRNAVVSVYLNETNVSTNVITTTSIVVTADGCDLMSGIRIFLPSGNRSSMLPDVSIRISNCSIFGDVILEGRKGVSAAGFVTARFSFSMLSTFVNASSAAIELLGGRFYDSSIFVADSHLRSGARALLFDADLIDGLNVTVLHTQIHVDHQGSDSRVGALSFVRDPSAQCPPAGSSLRLRNATILVTGSNVTVNTWEGYPHWPFVMSWVAPFDRVTWIAQGNQFLSTVTARIAFFLFCQNTNLVLIAFSNRVSVQPFDSFRVVYFADTIGDGMISVDDLVVTSNHLGSFPRQDQPVVVFVATILHTVVWISGVTIETNGGSLSFFQLTVQTDRNGVLYPASSNVTGTVQDCVIRHRQGYRSGTALVHITGVKDDVRIVVARNIFLLGTTFCNALFIERVAGLDLLAVNNLFEYECEGVAMLFNTWTALTVGISNSTLTLRNNSFVDSTGGNMGDTVIGIFSGFSGVNFFLSGRVRLRAYFTCMLLQFFLPVTDSNIVVEAQRFDSNQGGARVPGFLLFSKPVVNSTISVSGRHMSIGYPFVWLRFFDDVLDSVIVITSCRIDTTADNTFLIFDRNIDHAKVVVIDVNVTQLTVNPGFISGFLLVPSTNSNVTNSVMVVHRVQIQCRKACCFSAIAGRIQSSLFAFDTVNISSSPVPGYDRVGWLNQPRRDEVQSSSDGGDIDQKQPVGNRVWLHCVSAIVADNCTFDDTTIVPCPQSVDGPGESVCSIVDCEIMALQHWMPSSVVDRSRRCRCGPATTSLSRSHSFGASTTMGPSATPILVDGPCLSHRCFSKGQPIGRHHGLPASSLMAAVAPRRHGAIRSWRSVAPFSSATQEFASPAPFRLRCVTSPLRFEKRGRRRCPVRLSRRSRRCCHWSCAFQVLPLH